MPALGDATVVAVDPGAGTVTVAADRSRGSVTGDSLVVEDSAGAVVGLFEITGQQTGLPESVELEVAATSNELGDLQTLLAGELLSAHARARYGEVSASGSVRLAFDDDLEIGPADDPNPR